MADTPPPTASPHRPPRRRAALAAWRALLWALPLAVVGQLWARSYSTLDEWSMVDRDNVLWGAISYRGALHVIRAEHNSMPRRLTWDTYNVPRSATLFNLYDPAALVWTRLGFVKATTPPPPPPPAFVPPVGWRGRPMPTFAPPAAAPSLRRSIAPWLFTPQFVAYAAPYWLLAALFAIPTARAAWRLILRQLRARRGLCPGCGYDLRASETACPECGEAVVRPRVNAKGAAPAEPPLGIKSEPTDSPTRR